MNIVVAGGAGFLGSHLVLRLLELGHTVDVIDNLITSTYKNVSKLELKYENYTFFNGDITSLSDVSHLYFRKHDVVFNFACPASPKAYQKNPIDTMMTSVVGTKNLLDFSKDQNAVFVHASTSEIYGDPEISPQHESYKGNVNTLGIRACYDEGKRAAETLCFDYMRLFDLKIKVARIFNTYGPGMSEDDGRVVSNFIVQSLDKKPLTIYGDGKQTRSFCYVSDLIDAFLALMVTDDSFTGPVNIGNPNEFTILELAQRVAKITGTELNVCETELPQDDPCQRKPDISLAKSVLGWEPKIQLEDGLKKTFEYFLVQKCKKATF